MQIKFILVLIGFVFLCSCGDSGGGVGLFNTVTVTASASKTALDSDVAKWTDKNDDGAVCGSADVFTVNSDDVDVSISVAAKTNIPSNMEKSKVRIERVTVTYTAANSSSPSLPNQYQSVGVVIDPDGSATVSVRVASQDLKSGSTLSAIMCTSTIYTYYATLKFDGVEINTNNKETFETSLTVSFADFAESSS